MTTQRRSYETGHKPKCLVIVDETAEWDRAVYYASRWAIRVGGGVVMLRIIEIEDQNQQWLGVADIMRAEAEDAANEALDRASGRANGIAAGLVCQGGTPLCETAPRLPLVAGRLSPPGFEHLVGVKGPTGIEVLDRLDPRERCRDRLLLLNAFAILLLTLLGAAGESLGMDRQLRTSTAKRRA